MVSVLSRVAAFTNRHPVVRGMISYGTLWPTSCLIQQTLTGKNIETYDWVQAARFSLYGGLFTAPTLYAWIKISSKLWPVTNLKTSFKKAIVEQLTYGPAALICFFFGMSILEGRSFDQAYKEVEAKFVPTWKVGFCVWPILQTINFTYIKEKNRVPFVSACSLVWCCFLAYMHELKLKEQQKMGVLQTQSQST